MRFFNTSGPISPEQHYYLNPLERIDLDHFKERLEQSNYFILRSPRYTGKTTVMLALAAWLRAQSKFHAVYMNVEVAQAARDDVADATRAILSELSNKAIMQLNDPYVEQHWRAILEEVSPHLALQTVLARWSHHCQKPLVVLIDEIDALVGDTLLSVLRQLRSGYPQRPKDFPWSIVLAGNRDIRDHQIHSVKEGETVPGISAFNIKAESIRVGNFTREQVEALLDQHSEATGQAFEADVVASIWDLTKGHPWLVNALAYELAFNDQKGRDREQAVSVESVERAKQQLIARHETHLSQLTAHLREERVYEVIEPILHGSGRPGNINDEDIAYCEDLGLITTHPQLEIANPIYREIVPRALTQATRVTIGHESAWYVEQDTGRLDVVKLLTALQEFYQEYSEDWIKRFPYKEAGPYLLAQAFIERVIGDLGQVEREYGLGRLRMDLLITWKGTVEPQKIVMEMRRLRRSKKLTIESGLLQTETYMKRFNVDEGHLLLFERSDRDWDEKIYHRAIPMGNKKIHIWGF